MANSAQTVVASGSGVIQVVNNIITSASTFAIPHANQYSNVTGLTISITPKVSTSKIYLFANIHAVANANVTVGYVFANTGLPLNMGSGGTTADANTFNLGTAGTSPGQMWLIQLSDIHVPGTTATQAYTVQALCATAGTSILLNSTDLDTNSNLFGRFITEIIAMEII